MLFTFLILAFGCIFNTNVCESNIDSKQFLSNSLAMKPIIFGCDSCSMGEFCYVPADCGIYHPSCRGVCTPGCQKPEHCQSDETCFILPNFAYGYL